MTPTAHRRRPRYADRHPSRRQQLRRLALLGAAVADTPEDAAAVVAKVLRTGATGDALVTAFGAHAGDAPEAQGRLLVVLTDLEGRSLDEAARLLSLPLSDARELIERARTGDRPVATRCRGWGLASGRPGLTAAERAAGDDHLALCRHCRDHRAAVETARRQLAVRATSAAGLLAAAQVGVAGGAAGTALGGLVAGKLVTGAVAGLGAAVLATGATVAAAPPAGFGSDGAPAVVVPTTSSPGPTTRTAPSPGPLPTATVPPGSATTPLPTSLPTSLPASVPIGVDGGLPTSLPVPLPTDLPLPLPTLLPSPLLPLPTTLLPPLLP